MSRRLSVRTPKLAALTPLPSRLPSNRAKPDVDALAGHGVGCEPMSASRASFKQRIETRLRSGGHEPRPTDPYAHRFAGYSCLIQNQSVLRVFPLRAERHTRKSRCRVQDEFQSSGRNSNRFPSRCKSHSEKNSRIFSRLTGRSSPRSVTNPSIKLAGVTSNAGL